MNIYFTKYLLISIQTFFFGCWINISVARSATSHANNLKTAKYQIIEIIIISDQPITDAH